MELSLTEQVNAAVLGDYADMGWVKDNGDRDVRAARLVASDIVAPYIVGSMSARLADSIGLGKFTSEVWPNIAGPGAFDDEDDPAIAELKYKKHRSELWGWGKARGPLQTLLRTSVPGMTLIRTTLLDTTGEDKAVLYLTNDYTCLRQDMSGPSIRALQKADEDAAAIHVMLIENHPDLAAKFENEFRKQSRRALSASVETVQHALDVVTGNGTDDEDDAAEAA